MMPLSSAIKKLQLVIRGVFSVILARLTIAFGANYNAIINCPSPALLFGYAWHSIPTNTLCRKRNNIFPTPSTESPRFSGLVVHSHKFDSRSEFNNGTPPLKEWRKDIIDNYFYYLDGKWIGMHITRTNDVWYLAKFYIPLKHTVFNVIFCPNCDTENGYHLISLQSLREAKKIAECYYEKWGKVNHDLLNK